MLRRSIARLRQLQDWIAHRLSADYDEEVMRDHAAKQNLWAFIKDGMYIRPLVPVPTIVSGLSRNCHCLVWPLPPAASYPFTLPHCTHVQSFVSFCLEKCFGGFGLHPNSKFLMPQPVPQHSSGSGSSASPSSRSSSPSNAPHYQGCQSGTRRWASRMLRPLRRSRTSSGS